MMRFVNHNQIEAGEIDRPPLQTRTQRLHRGDLRVCGNRWRYTGLDYADFDTGRPKLRCGLPNQFGAVCQDECSATTAADQLGEAHGFPAAGRQLHERVMSRIDCPLDTAQEFGLEWPEGRRRHHSTGFLRSSAVTLSACRYPRARMT